MTEKDYVLGTHDEAASLVGVKLDRMLEPGRVSAEWVGQVRKDFRDAESDEKTLMSTPMVIEVIAERQ